MDYLTRRATSYRDLVLGGVTVQRLAMARDRNLRWFCEVHHETWCTSEKAKQLIGDYVRREFDGYGVSFTRKLRSKQGDFMCSFYSEAL